MSRLELDPTGERFGGLPIWGWKTAPEGLATRDQLRREGLRPACGQQVVGQIRWRSSKARHDGGIREAYLYRKAEAVPIGEFTEARAKGLAAAMRRRRTCRTCRAERPYYISTRLGECTTCADGLADAA